MNTATTSRRGMLGVLAAAPAIGLLGAASAAETKLYMPAKTAAPMTMVPDKLPAGSIAPASGVNRGVQGLYPRIGDVDVESYQDYLSGRRMYLAQLSRAARRRSEAILRDHGIDPTKPTDMQVLDIANLLKDDPLIARAARFGTDIHYDAFLRMRDHYHRHGDYYEDVLVSAEKKGPGALLLDAKLAVPDYTKHEIHNQVGGFSGDPFAGPIYYYGLRSINDGNDRQDEMYDTIARHMPLPADGKVRRILENATGPGQLATSLKRRFPDAEVWGIDVSGPMVRYAHQRANEVGVNVNFAQRLAEANGFPDNYFDIVTSTTFHHEVTAEASRKIFAEAQRTLRPGGIFRPAESGINGYGNTGLDKLGTYNSFRINKEVWVIEWAEMDPHNAIRQAGLKVDPNGAPGSDGNGPGPWLTQLNLVAVKA